MEIVARGIRFLIGCARARAHANYGPGAQAHFHFRTADERERDNDPADSRNRAGDRCLNKHPGSRFVDEAVII